MKTKMRKDRSLEANHQLLRALQVSFPEVIEPGDGRSVDNSVIATERDVDLRIAVEKRGGGRVSNRRIRVGGSEIE